MESEQIVTVPTTQTQTIDINGQMSDMLSSLTETLAPMILLSLILSVLFIVMRIITMFRRRKVEKAIFDIQKTLHEMNERDKARSNPQQLPARPEFRNEIIADSRNS